MGDHRRCDELFEGLSLAADGDTAEAKCRAALEHLGECAPCRRYLESLEATRDALGAQAAASALDEAEVARLLQACREALEERAPQLFSGKPGR